MAPAAPISTDTGTIWVASGYAFSLTLDYVDRIALALKASVSKRTISPNKLDSVGL